MKKDIITKYKCSISIMLSVISVILLKYIWKEEDTDAVFSNSILNILIAGGFYFIIVEAIEVVTARLFRIAYAGAWIYSACLVIGRQMYIYRELNLTIRKLLIIIIIVSVWALMIAAFLILLIFYIPRIVTRENKLRLTLDRIFYTDKKSTFFVAWLIMLASWIPMYMAFYPGVLAYDIVRQSHEIFTQSYTTHHPVVHTLYLEGCLKAGYAFTREYSTGIIFYSITQMLCMSGVFTYIIKRLKYYNVISPILCFVFAGFCIFPLHGLMSFIITKDIIFAGAMLLFIDSLVQLTREKETFFTSWSSIIKFCIIAIIMCAFRNQGIYVLVCTIPFIIWIMRGIRTKAFLLCISVVLLSNIFVSFLNKSVEAEQGSIAEMLCMPIQQIARTYNYRSESLSEEEKSLILEFIPEEIIGEYDERLADKVKNYVNDALIEEELQKFIKLWFSLGVDNPGMYLDAFLLNNLGFWYPDENYPAVHRYIETYMKPLDTGDNVIEITRESKFQRLLEFTENAIYNVKHESWPLFSMTFSIGFQFWILVFLFLIFTYYKKYYMMGPLIFLLVFWGVLMISPIVLLRYIYPMLICNIYLGAYIFNEKDPLSYET